jgi:hypothetical protein
MCGLMMGVRTGKGKRGYKIKSFALATSHMQFKERETKRKNFASATEPLPCPQEEN